MRLEFQTAPECGLDMNENSVVKMILHLNITDTNCDATDIDDVYDEPKVSQLGDVVFSDKDVVWLDVHVYKVVLVQMTHCLKCSQVIFTVIINFHYFMKIYTHNWTKICLSKYCICRPDSNWNVGIHKLFFDHTFIIINKCISYKAYFPLKITNSLNRSMI